MGQETQFTNEIKYLNSCDLYRSSQAEENKKKNAITPNKLFNTINTINNAGYEVQSIKNNAINVIKGF